MNGDWDQAAGDAYSDAVDAINSRLFDTFEALLGSLAACFCLKNSSPQPFY